MPDRPHTILVTGGAGYIGSHAADRLARDGRRVVIYDNLAVGHRQAVDRLRDRHADAIAFVEGDIGDGALLDRVFAEHPIDAVMHFAADALVGESVADPLRYYRNNTAGSLTLIEACHRARVGRFVFSSTCATYGEPGPARLPIREDCPQAPVNPYGWSKLAVERILIDAAKAAGFPFGVAILRYFNVAGCDRSGLLGEDHTPETHLIPIALQTALGRRDAVRILGTDYDTPDGTCVRDYIHVEDLVDAHAVVLDAIGRGVGDAGAGGDCSVRAYNLGIGRGVSVFEVIEAARRVTGTAIPVEHAERRPGDPPVLHADPATIRHELGWSASITDLDEIIATAWAWFRANPDGYRTLGEATGRPR